MMILEQNPRIGGAGGPGDLGQLEKLKDLKATGEKVKAVEGPRVRKEVDLNRIISFE